jgi:glycosyltransferase involved in cell wall biosynthesis
MRISVVVPAYNAAKYVSATLDSLLAQTRPAVDVVVVDDGSKDDTRSVLEPYRERVRLVFQTNSGVSAARNRGVAEATGDWIAFCDADDLWHADKLRVVSRVLDACQDADLLFHDFWTVMSDRVVEPRATHSEHTMFPLFRESDVTIPRILPVFQRIEVDEGEFRAVDTWSGHAFRWLMLGNFLMPSTVVVRRSAFLDSGGFDSEFRYAEDTEFFLRFGKTRSFVWVDTPLAGYRREAGTLLTGNMLPTIRNATRAVVKHCVDDRAVFEGDRVWVGRAVSRRFSRLAYYCLSELQLPEARVHARTALQYCPLDARAWTIAVASLLPVTALRLARTLKTRLG